MSIGDLRFAELMYHCKECGFKFRPFEYTSDVKCPKCGSPLLRPFNRTKKVRDIAAKFDDLLH